MNIFQECVINNVLNTSMKSFNVVMTQNFFVLNGRRAAIFSKHRPWCPKPDPKVQSWAGYKLYAQITDSKRLCTSQRFLILLLSVIPLNQLLNLQMFTLPPSGWIHHQANKSLKSPIGQSDGGCKAREDKGLSTPTLRSYNERLVK